MVQHQEYAKTRFSEFESETPRRDHYVSAIASSAPSRREDPEQVMGTILLGTLLGAVGGCVFGLGLFAVPGAGLLVALGSMESALFSTVVGAGVGATGSGLAEAYVHRPRHPKR